MKKNVLDTKDYRSALAAKTTDSLLQGVAGATYLTLLETAAGPHRLETVIYNCEFSTVSAVVIWLQERGCLIPADILATLGIEGI